MNDAQDCHFNVSSSQYGRSISICGQPSPAPSRSTEAGESSSAPAERVWKVPTPVEARKMGVPPSGEYVWISAWDAWTYFHTHRDLIAASKLTRLGNNKYYYYQVCALAIFCNTFKEGETPASVTAAWRRKNKDKEREIVGRFFVSCDCGP
ncbi:hypothetical protein LshimejAT787_0401030 [Lyophyllum shimeji]|uniref:Uncharacterized protein n=1 Tax=Lyophyllum shimeji TaxID=47721 RepID=A0A9P3PKL9_LYOSH|nr:hypothetical protein LshimejAT787_0401030 [Lyophyllum shimeji]